MSLVSREVLDLREDVTSYEDTSRRVVRWAPTTLVRAFSGRIWLSKSRGAVFRGSREG